MYLSRARLSSPVAINSTNFAYVLETIIQQYKIIPLNNRHLNTGFVVFNLGTGIPLFNFSEETRKYLILV